MKKSKLFVGMGAFVLAIAGVFASRANKKVNSFNSCYVSFSQGAFSGYAYISAASGLFTTQGPAGKQLIVKIQTASGGSKLVTTNLKTVTQGLTAYYR